MEVENERVVSGDGLEAFNEKDEETQKEIPLSPDEKKELEELRKKDVLKRDIGLLDEELKRKLKRNIKTETGEDTEDNVNEEVNKRLQEERKAERDDAIQDFLSEHASDYVSEGTREKLIEEVNQYKGADSASYREYNKLLDKAHRLIKPETRKSQGALKEFNENRANYSNISGETRRETSQPLTPLQRSIIKKMGLKEESYISELKLRAQEPHE